MAIPRVIVAAFTLVLLCAAANADTIAIIGTGDVGRALGEAFAAQGHTIVYGSRDPSRRGVVSLVQQMGAEVSATTQAEAAARAEIVVLAVPGMLAPGIAASLGDLSGKVIIDPTNPMERSLMTFGHGVETSNAELIQEQSPAAKVVKAFNTLSWETMADPASAGGPVSIPLAGDDGGAKKVVARLVEGMGLEAIDVGGVENAHWLEGMLILWINNRYGANMRPAFDYHLRKQ